MLSANSCVAINMPTRVVEIRQLLDRDPSPGRQSDNVSLPLITS